MIAQDPFHTERGAEAEREAREEVRRRIYHGRREEGDVRGPLGFLGEHERVRNGFGPVPRQDRWDALRERSPISGSVSSVSGAGRGEGESEGRTA